MSVPAQRDRAALRDQPAYAALAATLPQPVQDKFKGVLDLEAYNGDAGATLPLAATFVIAPDGTVVYRFVDTDYRKRAETGDILGALEKIAR